MFEIDQVLTPDAPHPTDPQRNVAGQFVKGSKASPGRAPKVRETAILGLLKQEVDPQTVVDTINDLINDTTSWRAREAGVKLYLAYMVGMPVQRSISATGKLETLLNRIGEMDEDEFNQVEAAMRRE